MRRGLRIAFGAAAAVLAMTPSALADHHFVSISEVFPGTTAQPGAEFVELQMYAAGQNNFSPATDLVFYNAAGGAASTHDLPDVASGATQRTLLAGTTSMETMFTVSADSEYSGDSLANAGGGVCLVSSTFGSVDCVAWGTATVPGAGTSAAAIPDGSSLERSLGSGCNTLLEPSDDTGSSLDDFAAAFPDPRPNSGPPTESSCPNTTITKKPKTKSKDRKPTFEFSGATDFECDLDEEGFEDCTSPYEPGKLSKGKHTIAVRATEADGSIDGSPATYEWTIKKKKRK